MQREPYTRIGRQLLDQFTSHLARAAKKKEKSFQSMFNHIKYKALERGIAVIEVPEFNTSKQCSRCGSLRTERPSQGAFICKDCGYKINANVN